MSILHEQTHARTACAINSLEPHFGCEKINLIFIQSDTKPHRDNARAKFCIGARKKVEKLSKLIFGLGRQKN